MGGLSKLATLGRALRELKAATPEFQQTADALSHADINRLGLELKGYANTDTALDDAVRLHVQPRGTRVGDPDQRRLTVFEKTPEEALNELGGYGASLPPDELAHLRNVENVLGRIGARNTNVIDATRPPPGLGAAAYRTAFGSIGELGPNVSTALTPINERRRTAAMISALLHDQTAGGRLVLDSGQPSSKLPFDALQFYRMDPDEQLGFLMATEKLRFGEDLPEVARQVFERPMSDRLGADIADAANRYQQGNLRGPMIGTAAWGPTTMKRAAITNQLLRGVPAGELPLTEEYLKGVGGFARGGRIERVLKKKRDRRG